jgi:hypothetical protein
MKKISFPFTSAVLLLALWGAVAQAEPVGRVLVAVGDTTALRNGTVVKLTRGAEVHSGDTLRVGDASNMQVRFSDEAVTALRSNSAFRIDDYQFEEKTNLGKSFFSLLKGGMRTITGLIGRFNRENYAVKAQAATIGIRGTHFVLAQCSNDCFNRDGSPAENGLFGGVTDGRISVNNDAGEREFGKNEFFHVAGADVLPRPLLAPPSFLRDQLEGQAKSRERKVAAAKDADSTGEGESSGAANGNGETSETAETVAAGSESAGATAEQQSSTAVTTQPTDGTPIVAQVGTDTQFVPTEQTAVQTNVSGGLINPTGQSYSYKISMINAWAGANNWTTALGNGTSLFSWSEAGTEQGTLTIVDSAKLLQAKDVLFADFVINQTPAITFFMNAYSASGVSDYYHITGNCGWNCVGTLAGTVSFNWSKSASTDVGADVAAGNLSWGRYTHTFSGTVLTGSYAGNTNNETSYEHWITGDPANLAGLPTAGTYSYSHIGGTRPTDQNGNVGTFAAGSTVGITFTSTGGLLTVARASWSMPVTNNTYSLTLTNHPVTFAQQTYTFSNAGWTETGVRTYISPINNTGVTCQGACSAFSVPISVNTSTVAPMLFGANAQSLALGISTSIPAGASPAENTASVQAYKTATPPM